MKRIWKNLSILITICLIVTVLGFNNSNITQAETGVALETEVESSTEVESETQSESEEVEKILLQSDQNWHICKYIDETEEPYFDIIYRGQTPEQIELNGDSLIVNIFVKDIDAMPYTLVWRSEFNAQHITEEILETYNKDDLIVSFSIEDSNGIEKGNSDYFSYYEEDLHMFYWDLGGYEYSIWRFHDGDSKVDVTIYFSEPLEGDITAIASSDNNEVKSFLEENPIEDIYYDNYSDEIVEEDIPYTMEYSIVSFSISIIDQVSGPEDGESLVKYIVDFAGVKSTTGKEVKPLVFSVYTPMIYDPNYEETTTEPATTEDPTSEDSTDEATTVEPTTEEPTTVYVEPTTKYVEPTSQKVEPTTTTQVTKKYVTKFKIKGKKSVKVGKKLKLKVVLTPKKATYLKIKWSVSKKKYAKISQKGVLIPKKAGKGKIVTVKVTITNTNKKIEGVKKTLTKTIKIKIK